jgi:hypothetical protein
MTVVGIVVSVDVSSPATCGDRHGIRNDYGRRRYLSEGDWAL